MSLLRRISSAGRLTSRMPLLAAVVVAGHLVWSPVQAATLGHSRLVSKVGEPLRVTIPVTQMSEADIESLRVVPAPVSEWARAGLTPPVDPATLQSRLMDGFAPGAHLLQIWSDQAFNQPIADLLLDIHTSRGVQRYQVSLLARGGATAIQAPAVQSTDRQSGVAISESSTAYPPIVVNRGDTMFAIAQRHAVSGVSVYQMMIALQRANPQAFIHDNLNLVKAGEKLAMPDRDALTAISDREARRLFHEQVVAFNAYRQGHGDPVAGDIAAIQPSAQAKADSPISDAVSNVPPSRQVEGDQLRLSSGRPAAVVAVAPSGTDKPSGDLAQANNVQSDIPADTANSAVWPHAGNNSATDFPNQSNAVVSSGPDAPSNLAAPTPSVPSGAAVTPANGNASPDDGAAADDAQSTRLAIKDAEQRVSQLEENVKNLNRALQSQGEAAKDVVIDGAIGLRQSLTDMATAVTEATIGDEDFVDEPAEAGQTDTASPSDDASQLQQTNLAPGMMESIATWLHTHFIGVVTALLALFVLIIAWILRRANIAQSRSEGAITPEMVQEKLDNINLDLNEPSVGEPRSRS